MPRGMMAGMNRLQFSLLGLLFLMTGFAVYAGILVYVRPRHSAILFAVPLGVMAIIWSVYLVPGRHGKWLLPMTVVLVGLACFALGLWLQGN
jgi:hypothetical protein